MITTTAPRSKQIKKYKMVSERTGDKIESVEVSCSKDLAEAIRKIHEQEGNDIQEFFYVLFLNRRNLITGYQLMGMGGMNSVIADARLILRAALLNDCSTIVLSHNHPSGNIRPSKPDEGLTNQLINAGKYHDIKVLDHIIFSNDNQQYFSFADEGLMYS